MNFKVGDKVVVKLPTAGLPAFNVSGQVGRVNNVEVMPNGSVMLVVDPFYGSWDATRFEKYETKRVM